MLIASIALSLLVSGLSGPQAGASTTAPPPKVLANGNETDLKKRLTPELPTVCVFYKPSSTLERAFVAELRRDAGSRVGFVLIELKTGQEPIARQYAVQETPTAQVYDRRGRLVTSSTDPQTVRAAVRKAAGVMRIDWAEEGDPRFAEAQRLLGRPMLPGILRTMSLKPEYMDYINVLSLKAHFADGFLTRREKEMIATYVSALNKCKY